MNINLKLKPFIYNQLKELRSKYKLPITSMINMILAEKLQDELDNIEKTPAIQISKMMKNQKLDYYQIEADKEVRLKITNKEREYLINQAKITGTDNLTNEIRHRLLKSIYKQEILNPLELKEFKNLVYQIKMIGLNINGIFKRVNFKEELKNDDYINLQNSINDVNAKIDLIVKELKKAFKFHNIRI